MTQTYPHRIRLRGPWLFEPVGAPPVTVMMPTSWGEFADRGVFRRRFGYPGRIDSYERVWLTLARVLDRADVALNGSRVGLCETAGEFEVTSLLRPRNELVVAVEGPVGGGLVGDVALEVRATAFLRGVVVRREGGTVVATGEVVGHATGPLELYLVVDQRPADYATVTPGSSFRLAAVDDAFARVAVVELVRGAVPWYTVEFDLHTA